MNTAPATIIRIGNHRRGSVHTTHVQLALRGELRVTACGRELNALDWRLVGPTESSSQHLPCQPCIRAELADDDQCESCGALDGEPCECIEAADAIDAGGIDVDWPVTMLLDDDAWTVGAPNWRPATGRPELGVARRAFPGSERRCDRCRTGGEHAYYVAAHDGRRYADARSLCEPCSLELLAPPTDTVPQTLIRPDLGVQLAPQPTAGADCAWFGPHRDGRTLTHLLVKLDGSEAAGPICAECARDLLTDPHAGRLAAATSSRNSAAQREADQLDKRTPVVRPGLFDRLPAAPVHVDLLDTSAVPDAALAQTAFTLELATPLRSGQLELL